MLANVDESCEKIVASRKKIVKLNGGVFTYSKKMPKRKQSDVVVFDWGLGAAAY